MSPAILAVIISAAAFVIVLLVGKRFDNSTKTDFNRRILNELGEEQQAYARAQAEGSIDILKSEATGLAAILPSLPKGEDTYRLILRAGLGASVNEFLMFCIGLFFVAWWGMTNFFAPLTAFLVAIAIAILLPRFYLRRRIAKRNEAFINQFPDAVDMIVRSVKSGHPLNAALRMIAENMENPIRSEFKVVVDEIAFGRSTVDALQRLTLRIDEPDLQFFVVILSVQQETGGNLAEVLSNLSAIIRKRKQLRLKIKALTSEGRATAYILGGLPFFVFGAIHLTSPDYLLPLFNTDTGNLILYGSLGLIALAAFIVRNMMQIDI